MGKKDVFTQLDEMSLENPREREDVVFKLFLGKYSK
jgi:hypothetical protein